MKPNLYTIIGALFIAYPLCLNAQIGIGTALPHESAQLEIQSQTKGVLIPRMTATNRIGINNPGTGLIVFQTDGTSGFYFYTGSSWVRLIADGSLSLDGLTDAKVAGTGFTNSMLVGQKTTGTLDDARNNTGLGINVLKSITEGDDNTALGYDALSVNTSGAYNTAIGAHALKANTTGIYNTAVGQYALTANNTGWFNVAVGIQSMNFNTTGQANTAVGRASSHKNTTGLYNVAIGNSALWGNQTGSHNTAVGTEAMAYATASSGYHTAVGYGALENISTGFTSTAVGNWALRAATTGGQNTAVGQMSLYKNTEGRENAAFGHQSLFQNITGIQNSGYGHHSLYNTTADGNTGIGYYALRANTSGAYNTAIGYKAGDQQTTFSNTTSIGYNAQVSGDNQIQLGDANTSVYVYGSVQNRSDGRDKKDIKDTKLGLDFILSLRPVDYHYDIRDGYPTDASGNQETDGSHKRNTLNHGFIAQEVESVLNQKGLSFGGVNNVGAQGGKDVYYLGYTEFIAPLTKAIQEQQEIIRKQQAEIDALKKGMKRTRRK